MKFSLHIFGTYKSIFYLKLCQAPINYKVMYCFAFFKEFFFKLFEL